MKLPERKEQLLLSLSEHGINGELDLYNKSVINIPNGNIWILSNFGGQVVLSNSKKQIQTIRETAIEQITYDDVRINYFAIPGWWSKNNEGKKGENGNKWCFIDAHKVYHSIKVYKDDDEKTWTKSPKKDWKANINNSYFYWKSDKNKYKLDVNWENYDNLIRYAPFKNTNETSVVNETDGLYLVEGKLVESTSYKYERNSKARELCLEHYGFICKICEYDGSKHFTVINHPIIDVHHITPVAQIGEEYEIDPIADLVPLCPNCHRFVHSREEPYSVVEAIDLMKK